PALAVPKRSALPAGVGPAPLSASERAAVQLALAYLRRGPDAWVAQLAPGAELGKLALADASGEIAARLGPREGAHWQLQRSGPGEPADAATFTIALPSGVDEAVILDLHLAHAGTI